MFSDGFISQKIFRDYTEITKSLWRKTSLFREHNGRTYLG